MRWKQYFTPVQSMDPETAKAFMAEKAQDEFTLLDVRQPGEYQKSHIPGAKLIPIGQLDKRLDEIDRGKPVLAYCAVGGRSRVAAQMLAGKGFDRVINLSGGIKAWEDPVASGSEDQGLDLFTGDEPVEETLIIAYALESGLREFYLSMIERVTVDDVASLFRKLSDVEQIHQDRVLEEYLRITGEEMDRETFESKRVAGAVEGGRTTDEYMERFEPGWSTPSAIVDLAMSIEAQALDLYTRAANRSRDERGQRALKRLAEEERTHLERLAEWMDRP
jgi:rhodanese-related sulfurtransferase/rubrerythrin